MRTIRTPFNYKLSAPGCPSGEFVPCVAVDTSVDTAMRDASTRVNLKSSKGLYTNSDTPVNIFGNGITVTPFDPILHATRSESQSIHAAQVSESVGSAPTNAAAAAVSSQNAE